MAYEYDRLRALAESDPEQFQRLISELEPKVVRPHAAQQVVLDSDARFKVMNCGRRFGKTKLAAKIILEQSRKGKKMLWWCAPTYKVVKRGYAEVLRQLPDGVLTHAPPPESNFDAGRQVILRFKNGTKLEFYSAERPEGMLGEGVDFAVLDEAATMPARIWNQIVSPTLIDRMGGALLISTPRGRNWFHKVWQMGQDPQRSDWASWTFTTADNPTLPEGEVERLRAALPRLEFEQEIEAQFVAAGSATFVIPDSSVQRSKVLPNSFIEGMRPEGHIVLGVDLARTNDFTVIYGARAKDRRNCYYERMQAITWPEQKRRIRRAVALLMRAGAEGVTLIMDSTGVGDPVYEDLEADGYDVIGIKFGNENKNNMVKLLAKDLELSHAFVLEEGLHEFEDYTMTVTPGGKWTYSAPEGDNDDVVSAKMLQHHGLVNEGVPGVTVLDGSGVDVTDDHLEPWERTDEEDFSDLIDPDIDPDQLAAYELGFERRVPTTEELIQRPEVWF